jgi:HAD superfamily hydrolase (TIGR01509 family)
VPRPVRAVTVDFWGTLVVEGPRADDRYRERRITDFEVILRGAGFHVAARQLARGYEQSGRELTWVWSENRDVPVLRHVASVLEGAEPGLSARVTGATLEALVEAYAAPALLVPPKPDPGARAGLEALVARGLRLAVVSNTMRTPGRTLRRILEGHGLLAPFQHLTFSDEVGVRKPAPEIFRLTLAVLGIPATAAVHVGDDAVLDVQGAREAGLRTVQVVPAGGEPASPAPDVVIEGLGDLPGALETLEGRA